MRKMKNALENLKNKVKVLVVEELTIFLLRYFNVYEYSN